VNWRFTVADAAPWTGNVNAAPVELKERAFIGAAVPQLAAAGGDVPSAARVVVCHVTAPARHGPLGGPVGRAKGLLDACTTIAGPVPSTVTSACRRHWPMTTCAR